MNTLIRTGDSTLHGLHAIHLENGLLRLTVLPGAGGKLWQIVYKPFGAQLLWHHPRVLPALHAAGTLFDDVWSGGWDEIFPNDEAGCIHGKPLPDHGELWAANWYAEAFNGADAVGVHLRCATPVSRFQVEKTILLRPEQSVFETCYRFTNRNPVAWPFLWKLHPAFAISPHHRIDFPQMTVVREPMFPGTLGAAPRRFPWPYAPIGNSPLDLREVPELSSGALHFFYGTKMAEGWCGITDRARGLACALRFDLGVLSGCTFFASYGGWRGLQVAVPEPATGYPFQIEKIIDAGRARWLAPGESLETSVLFAVQEGFTSIGEVDPAGRILPGDEMQCAEKTTRPPAPAARATAKSRRQSPPQPRTPAST
jgi:hypothetical protein